MMQKRGEERGGWGIRYVEGMKLLWWKEGGNGNHQQWKVQAMGPENGNTKAREPLPVLTRSEAPSVLPYGWEELPPPDETVTWFLRNDGLRVIVSASRERDGKRWLHASMSRPNSLPSWGDVRDVKSVFVGDHRTAVQILPPESKYVNIHPYVLHLWCCLDGDIVPDFVTEGMI